MSSFVNCDKVLEIECLDDYDRKYCEHHLKIALRDFCQILVKSHCDLWGCSIVGHQIFFNFCVLITYVYLRQQFDPPNLTNL